MTIGPSFFVVREMVGIRRARKGDLRFLWELHVSTMRDYVEATYGWDDDDQRKRFDAGFLLSHVQIIEMNGESIGLWETDREVDPWFLARVAIVPDHQNEGIGSSLIAGFLAEADKQKRNVRLQVLKVNPAKTLYDRLGFVTCEESDTHFKMLRKADSHVSTA